MLNRRSFSQSESRTSSVVPPQTDCAGLAAQTADATEEISASINEVQGSTGEAVSAIKDITDAIDEISNVASMIATAVENQGAATQEISRSVEGAAQGSQDVTTNIAEVSRVTFIGLRAGTVRIPIRGVGCGLEGTMREYHREVEQERSFAIAVDEITGVVDNDIGTVLLGELFQSAIGRVAVVVKPAVQQDNHQDR